MYLHLSLLMLWLSVVSSEDQPSMNETEVQQMLDAHNKYRSEVAPTATAMLMMDWSNDLANYAQEKADRCIYDHGNRIVSGTYGKLGENLYITSGKMPVPGFPIDQSVKLWDDEKNYFNFDNNQCDPGIDCGHYTQVVWHNSNLVGCAKKYCTVPVKVTETKTLQTSTIIFCEYVPTGNVQAGFLFNLKPARPFTQGVSCSDCPEDANICVNNLCLTKAQEAAYNSRTAGAATTGPVTTESTTPVTITSTPKKEDVPSHTTKPEDRITTSTKVDEDDEYDDETITTRSFHPENKSLSCKSCSGEETGSCLMSEAREECESKAMVCVIEATVKKAFARCEKEYDCDAIKDTANSSTKVVCCYTDLCNTFNITTLFGGGTASKFSPTFVTFFVLFYLSVLLFAN